MLGKVSEKRCGRWFEFSICRGRFQKRGVVVGSSSQYVGEGFRKAGWSLGKSSQYAVEGFRKEGWYNIPSR